MPQPSVISTLRQQILSGSRAANSKLNQSVIAEEMKISRIPVRDALRSLEVEGLVLSAPNRGSWVRAYSRQDVEDIFDMRLALEPILLRYAMPNLTHTDLGKALDIQAELDQADNPMELADGNWRFHEALYKATGRDVMMETLKRLHTMGRHAQMIGLSVSMRPHRSKAEHLRLVKYCQDKDQRQAVRLLESHLASAKEAGLQAIKEGS